MGRACGLCSVNAGIVEGMYWCLQHGNRVNSELLFRRISVCCDTEIAGSLPQYKHESQIALRLCAIHRQILPLTARIAHFAPIFGSMLINVISAVACSVSLFSGNHSLSTSSVLCKLSVIFSILACVWDQ